MGSAFAGITMALLMLVGATPAAAICGDADASSTITATDALGALRSSVSLTPSCTPTFCDVNRSETITATDALIILGYAVGLETRLNCGGSGLVDLDACSNGTFFSVAPVADTDIQALVPLGNLNPPAHTFPTDHIYFFLPDSNGDGSVDTVAVSAPGDAWITQIDASTHLSENPVFTDYSITLAPCADYTLTFGHIQSLSPLLSSQLTTTAGCHQYSTGGKDYRYCNYNVRIEVSAGDLLGSAGGTYGQNALDLWAHDYRSRQNVFANDQRILNGSPKLFYAACPIDAFAPGVREQLAARFSDYSGNTPRTIKPVCGEMAQDIAGSAQGIWLRNGVEAFYPEDPHLALVHDNFDPTLAVFSLGSSLPSLSGLYRFAPTASGVINRDFSQVAADGSTYCYDYGSGAILLRMDSDEELRIEHQPSTTCADGNYSLSVNAASFVR